MVYVTAVTTVSPANRDEVVAALLAWTETARQLPGVISHGFFADLNDENTIRFYAEYESEADWKASTGHPQNAAMREVLKANALNVKGGQYSAVPLSDNA